jgi:enoyl-CoA hydratase
VNPDGTDILVQHDGAIATVVFNRPRTRNAITYAMWLDIARMTEGLVKDDSVRAIVYRGAGTVAFASGADISEFEEQRKDLESSQRYNAATGAAYGAIRECPKPTIAMIYGFCMGGAMGIAMGCDLRFAAEGSKFGIPAAKDILFSARTVDDREALAIGLIQRLVAPDALERATYEYLKTVADNAPQSVRGSKQAVQFYRAGFTDERRRHLRDLAREAFESTDYKEGTRAFLEKRPPKFQGR